MSENTDMNIVQEETRNSATVRENTVTKCLLPVGARENREILESGSQAL